MLPCHGDQFVGLYPTNEEKVKNSEANEGKEENEK